ncbi:hypothetical protein FIBSPDRAFT_754579, partial [Athelia psychrophila]
TDSGLTKRSLSLTSKYLRKVSEPFKLQSIALFGRNQITSFERLLIKTPPRLHRVQFLFISSRS